MANERKKSLWKFWEKNPVKLNDQARGKLGSDAETLITDAYMTGEPFMGEVQQRVPVIHLERSIQNSLMSPTAQEQALFTENNYTLEQKTAYYFRYWITYATARQLPLKSNVLSNEELLALRANELARLEEEQTTQQIIFEQPPKTEKPKTPRGKKKK